MARIDLHTHSYASDGTQAPAELVSSAAAAGLDIVALTDHDSFAGWAAARACAQELGLGFVPGIEFSTVSDGAPIHLLGYLVDAHNDLLSSECERIRESRLRRAESMVNVLSRKVDIGWDDVLEQVHGSATVGRPHIADALVAKGIEPTRSAAFKDLLSPRSGCYVPYYSPSLEHAIETVVQAGGVPVLAHPGSYRRGRVLTDAQLEVLVGRGLAGVEVGHRENDAAERARLLAFARSHHLVVTGSSDYHGAGKPNRLGENVTDPADLDRILELGTGSSPYLPDRLLVEGEAPQQ